MFCKKCGAKIAENQKFCTGCGAVVTQTHSEEKNAVPPQTPPPSSQQTFYANPQPAGNPFVVTDWYNSYFDGSTFGLWGVNFISFLLSLITVGLCWPAIYCFKLRWVYRHTVVGGYRLKFTGKGIQLFGKMLLWFLLSLITIGIYTFFLPVKIKKWETKHIVIASQIPVCRN